MQTQFDTFISKLGEHGVQAILENWERYMGIKRIEPMPLERRWAIFMRETAQSVHMAA